MAQAPVISFFNVLSQSREKKTRSPYWPSGSPGLKESWDTGESQWVESTHGGHGGNGRGQVGEVDLN